PDVRPLSWSRNGLESTASRGEGKSIPPGDGRTQRKLTQLPLRHPQPLVFWRPMDNSELPPVNPPLQLDATDAAAVVSVDLFGASTPAPAAVDIPSDPEIDTTLPAWPADADAGAPTEHIGSWTRMGRETVSGLQTLVSAAGYATLIVTFG